MINRLAHAVNAPHQNDRIRHVARPQAVPPTPAEKRLAELRDRRESLRMQVECGVSPLARVSLNLAMQVGTISDRQAVRCERRLQVFGYASVLAGTPGDLTAAQCLRAFTTTRSYRVNVRGRGWCSIQVRGVSLSGAYRDLADLVTTGALTRDGDRLRLLDPAGALGDVRAHLELQGVRAEIGRLLSRKRQARWRGRQRLRPVGFPELGIVPPTGCVSQAAVAIRDDSNAVYKRDNAETARSAAARPGAAAPAPAASVPALSPVSDIALPTRIVAMPEPDGPAAPLDSPRSPQPASAAGSPAEAPEGSCSKGDPGEDTDLGPFAAMLERTRKVREQRLAEDAARAAALAERAVTHVIPLRPKAPPAKPAPPPGPTAAAIQSRQVSHRPATTRDFWHQATEHPWIEGKARTAILATQVTPAELHRAVQAVADARQRQHLTAVRNPTRYLFRCCMDQVEQRRGGKR